METIKIYKTRNIDLNDNFDALCAGFDGGNFYGLEYILEEFFQDKTINPSVPARPSVDWFGLYNLAGQ